MSAVQEGEGPAAVEDVTVACLGIWLERQDTSGTMGRERWTGKLTFQRCLGRRTARCSFLRSKREAAEEQGDGNSAGGTEAGDVRKRRELVRRRRTYDWKQRHRRR